jgi:flagellar FliL protein
MFNNKLFNMSLIVLIGMSLLGVIGFVLWKYTFEVTAQQEQIVDARTLSADELVELSVETDVITTNLYTQDFIVIQFSVTLDSKKTKEEFEKRLKQARSTIISVLASMSPDDLRGEEGINHLEAVLMQRFNDFLQEGKVIKVSTIDRKIQ